MTTVPLKLSAVKPDFPSILMQLQLFLQAKGTWTDLQTSGTGETLIEMMASVATFNQFAVESAARESTLTTAVRDSSVYAITRMLGVRIHRKSPANVEVSLERSAVSTVEALTIPTFTQFDVNGKDFFNRHPLMFSAGSDKAAERLYHGSPVEVIDQTRFKLDYSLITSLKIQTNDQFKILVSSGLDAGKIKTVEYIGGNVGENLFQVVSTETSFTDLNVGTRISLLRDVVRLYQGTVIEETFTSDGTVFQQYYLNDKKFAVSDTDIEVRVYDETAAAYNLWGPTPDGLWVSGPYDQVYFDSTSGLGQAIIAFGDGTNGASPKLGNTVKVKYAITEGSSANNGLTNLNVGSSLGGISGVTVSVITNGADEKPASYYRVMAPLIFKARNRGVTPSDYKAVALDYPGIISVSVLTQRDVAPDDIRWMNQIQICLLPSAAGVNYLTPAEWDDFLTYMDKKKHAAVNIVPKDPTRQTVEIDLTIALKAQYVVSSVVPVVEAAVRALFNRQSDTLGRRITVSDITHAALVTGVDYVDVNRCLISGEVEGVRDLIPQGKTHFLEISILTTSTKYSEREIYSGS